MVKAVILKKNLPGKQPIYIRVYRGKKDEVYKRVGISIEPEHFDHKNCRVKDYHPLASDLNKIIVEHENQYNKESVSVKSGSFNNGIKLVDYWNDHLVILAQECAESHIKNLESIVNKFDAFRPNELLNNVDYTYLKEFKTWCMKPPRENSINTISKNMEQLRAVIYEAIKDKKYNPLNDPFKEFKLNKEETKAQRLSPKEIKKLEEYETINRHELLYKITFLFSFYNGGIRFSDLCLLKWENILFGEITFTPQKTKRSIAEKIVKVSPKVKVILDVLRKEFETETYVFPFLDKKKITKEHPFEYWKDVANGTINGGLKRLSSKLKFRIGKDISIHKARHSFADYAVEMGIDPYTMMQLLGHKKFSTTQIYLKKFNKKTTGHAIDTLFGTNESK